MATTLRFRRRASGGAAGAPAGLSSAEPAYNMADGIIYIGFGDDGSGNATSIKAIAQDNFWKNIPSDGANGDILTRTAAGVAWSAAPEGSVYTASGNGIELVAGQFSLNYSEIATGLSLGNYLTSADAGTTYATITALNTGLAGKADSAHTHDAADITSGVFDIARIPVLPGNQVIVSSGGIAVLDAGQQAEIDEGTVVTTTDGRRWVYSGTGSKTLEASYIELADITPEWSVIANKPGFALVATSGSYNDLTDTPALAIVATSGSYTDLTNKPTLGTMAAQNANAVAITGGTIEGVTLDGGTF